MFKSRTSLLTVLLVAACSSQTTDVIDTTGTINEASTMAPGDTRKFDGLVLTFNSVSDDSRCPSDVQCIWAGDATAHFSLHDDNTQNVNFDLHVNGTASSATVMGHIFKLTSLKPEPRSTVQIKPEEYRVTVGITQIQR